jgi:molybdopterin-containing oxidoreductase family membrane subunit
MSSAAPEALPSAMLASPEAAGRDRDQAGAALLPGEHSYASISEKISGIVLTAPTARWWTIAFMLCSALTLVFFGAIGYLFYKGVGIWGLNVPVVWAFDITNYVWWIAIAMSGTFISAALHLTRQPWGASISRFAEAMTIFALAIAGMFPILHLGRPWFFYWLAPYPNVMSLWPQWRSPLVWDFFAILAYLLLSLMFWYLGLIPDFATLRDRARRRSVQIAYGLLALGWRGEARHWQRRQSAHLLLAGLAVPLVVSVHSVVGLDFATGNTPGWHSTIFPPFFVAGAMFSGFAMAMTIAVLLRRAFDLRDFITDRHLDNLAKLILAMGLVLAYSYVMEIFMAWYSADRYEIYTALNRMRGPYAPVYWALILCVVVVPQALWSRRVRHSPWVLFAISIVINVGMWLERFMLIVTSEHRDFLPSAWGMFYPTIWDWAILFGSIGFFAWLLLLFVRFLPLISMTEMRELLARQQGGS